MLPAMHCMRGRAPWVRSGCSLHSGSRQILRSNSHDSSRSTAATARNIEAFQTPLPDGTSVPHATSCHFFEPEEDVLPRLESLTPMLSLPLCPLDSANALSPIPAAHCGPSSVSSERREGFGVNWPIVLSLLVCGLRIGLLVR